ncbi:NB-ARC domain-containing protein [Actinocrispum wychmicini]|uniref:NB-ARC domain-containing protein n=2 Tax=Actinocrispum wychmicini TaxID=1213861 RepID=A0A4V2S7B1_9PSEU|nr:NB-ARC domain-containing protein [Actinocrispum wychmicini]
MLAVVTGAAGVGKTALALSWLHSRTDRFPDGQLYADLSAFGPTGPATPGEILGRLLRGMGMSGDAIPLATAERAALFRSVTADKAVALLFDDAASAGQVRALLPASAHCVVVVTSRRRLGGLAVDGAVMVSLGPLQPQEAADLIGATVGPDRVAAEPAAARELASLCGGMPIALRIAAARLTSRPRRRLAGLVSELADERHRLDVLAVSDDSVSVQASFDLSYRELPGAAARMYRLLALHPGAQFGSGVAAAAIGMPVPQAAELLDVLVQSSMLVDVAEDCYRFHDLLRLHARRYVEVHEPQGARQDAVRAMVVWYLDQAVAADALITPLRRRFGDRYQRLPQAMIPTPRIPQPNDTSRALDALQNELPNLLAAQDTAARCGWDELVWQLGEALWGVFLYRSHYPEWMAACERGARAAAQCGNLVAESRMLVQLAAAYLRLNQPDTAMHWCQQAWERAEEAGDGRSQATALENLGAAAHAQGRLADAIGYYRRSLDLNEQHHEVRGVALLQCYLGYALSDHGEPDSAIDSFQRSAETAASISDHHCRAQAIVGIGTVYARQGQFALAIAEMTAGLEVLSATAVPALRVAVLERLGEVSQQAGDLLGARHNWEQALDLYERMGDPKAERVRDRLHALTTPDTAPSTTS